ncbi:MAG: M48 family metalloprotease [Magnetococcales bacterium]|nr:M48 family metalloprotease [Magnetococcales bacterium]
MKKNILLLWLLLLFPACAVNPVTGERELAIINESQELAIGSKQYRPSRQSQGGDYVADPELVAYVQEVGSRLANVSDRKLPYEFVVINSSIPNAWALPGGKIAINRGLLLELESEGELAAVLGHEIVHAAARHSARGIERGILLQGVTMATSVAIKKSAYAGYSDIAIKGAGLATNLVTHKYGRDAERESDHYGMLYMERAGYDPREAITLQETFVRLQKSANDSWLAGLFATHPPSKERVEENRKFSKELKQGGYIGREKFEKMIARLKRAEPAYKAYEAGVEALHGKKYIQAKKLAQKAIEIEPAEGLFYALLGDVQLQEGDKEAAAISYDRAILANPDFFLLFEKRGKLRQLTGDRSGASADMKKAAALFPTVNSYLALGSFAEKDGDRAKAIKYYRDAAQSDSEKGRLAEKSLVRLDLSSNPNQYLKAHFVLDSDGNLLVSVKNPTPIAVDNVTVVVMFTDAVGQLKNLPLSFSREINPGQSQTVVSGISGVDGRLLRKNGFKVVVTKAGIYK